MGETKDKAEENQDKEDENQDKESGKTDETPGETESSPGGKKPAPKKDTETVTKAEAKKMADEAEKRGRGRADKELSDQVKELREEAQKRKDADFTRTAKTYGMDEEKLKGVGITEAHQIVAQAAIFGKEPLEPNSIIDDGESVGGGETSEKEKLDKLYPTMAKKS